MREMPDASRRRESVPAGRGLALLVEALKSHGAVRIILFGSAGRGDADAESDLDVVAVIPTTESFVSRLAAVAKILPREVPPADVLVYTPEEYARMLAEAHPFLARVLAEGKVLYEA